MKIILETDRLYLREMDEGDFDDLCSILQDKEVMYAYEHAFSDEEVKNWLNNQLKYYKEFGFGLWASVLKETGEFIGQTGLTVQPYNDSKVLEIGYLFKKKFWHNGYAIEAAKACRDYAFNVLKKDEVYSIIRDNNVASINVAKRNGMVKVGEFIKHYCDMDVPHYLFCVKTILS